MDKHLQRIDASNLYRELYSRETQEIMVKHKLQTMNRAAITDVAFVKKLPADLENIKLSCDTPIPKAPPSDFCIKTRITNIIARITFAVSKIFSMVTN